MKEFSKNNYAILSKAGPKHEVNQDSVVAYFDEHKPLGFIIVCDGVGGYPGGEIASQITTAHFYKAFLNKDVSLNWETWFLDTLKTVKVELQAYVVKRPDLKEMATTLCLTVVDGEELHVFNLGDSMAYVYNKASRETLTVPQNLYNYLKRTGKSMSNLNVDARQMASLVNYVSADSPKKIWFDYKVHPLKPEEIVVVCSDGVYKFIDLSYYDLFKLNPVEMCEKIISLAVLNETNDDASVGVWYRG
ncbi:PP2C family protein-serine/threonine phosphatase [Ureaplasma ceti]|uniref:Serine/threonine-protein phosphatase n=1 Tax=Ureaplasma ceti TaxID=3119530 RepID=A0ABP9U568_9BACT